MSGPTLRDHVATLRFFRKVSAAEKAGKWQQALHLLDDASAKRLQANVHSGRTVLKGLLLFA